MEANRTVIAALTEDQMVKITGLSRSQLRAWDNRGFFIPAHVFENRRVRYSRIYSFKDAVGLKTISLLKNTYKVSLQKLVKVAEKLEEKGFKHWADVKLYVVKKEVHFKSPQENNVEGIETGQLAMVPIIDVITDVESQVEQLKKRSRKTYGELVKGSIISRDEWVVSGTRIPVSFIRKLKDAGYSYSQIKREYPSLTTSDIKSALAHQKTLEKTA